MWLLLGASGLAALLKVFGEAAQLSRLQGIFFNTGIYSGIYSFDEVQKTRIALTILFSVISIALYLATVFSVVIRRYVSAIYLASAAIFFSTVPEMAINSSWRVPGLTDLINQGGFLNVLHFVVNYPGQVDLPSLLLGFLFYPLVLICAIAAFSLAKRKQTNSVGFGQE
jgi:hypothetical protein